MSASRRHRLPSTESLHARAEDLDSASAEEIVRRLHEEDRLAVRAAWAARRSTAHAAELVARCLGAGGRLIYVGAGTSGRLGVLDAAECPPTFGTEPRQVQAVLAGGGKALTRAVEGAEDDPAAAERALRKLRVGWRDVVCAISASARTPFALGALKAARRAGASTILVCCAKPPPRSADVVVFADTGPELVAGSTRLKAGTATKLVLNAISTAAMIRLGKIFRGRMVDLVPTSAKLRARAARIVAELTGLSANEAAALARAAGHRPSVALVMHLMGASGREAERMLEARPLRAIARGRYTSDPKNPPATSTLPARYRPR